MRAQEPPWTKAEDAKLIALWSDQSLTQKQMAEQIGRSRHSLTGARRRLGLEPRPDPTEVYRARALQRKAEEERLLSGGAVVEEGRMTFAPPPPVVGQYSVGPVLPARRCQYPMWGYNEKPTQKFCDAPAVGRSFCAQHRSFCYLPVNEVIRQRRAEELARKEARGELGARELRMVGEMR